jgi:hypothetical protein
MSEVSKIKRKMIHRSFSITYKSFLALKRYPQLAKQLKHAPEGYDPGPQYEIPHYLIERAKAGKLKVNASRERYMRPTHDCQSTAPEIVALAHDIGAYKLSNRYYANNVFGWVKNNIRFDVGGYTAIETLEDGRGLCDQKVGLLIALSRAGGLKARYGIITSENIEYDLAYQQMGLDMIGRLGETGKMIMGNFSDVENIHLMAEVYIDGKWIPAEPTYQDALEAGWGLPITKFGDEPKWAALGNVSYLEALPRFSESFMKRIRKMQGLAYLIDSSLKDTIERGKKELEMGESAYNERLKKRLSGLKEDARNVMKDME